MRESIVYNRDCLEAMREMRDKALDLAIVDPPYGIQVGRLAYTQKEGRSVRQSNGSRLTVAPLGYKHGEWDAESPPAEYFKELWRVSKNQIVWGWNYQNLGRQGGAIIWNKCVPSGVSFSDAEIAFCSMHERVRMFTYLWAGMCQGESVNNGHIQRGNKSLNEKRIHPTQKPVALYKWLLTNYAKPGDTILDTHLGSGSSRIAAYDLGFDFTGYELDTDYFNAQEKRFADHIAQPKLFAPDSPVYVQENIFADSEIGY